MSFWDALAVIVRPLAAVVLFGTAALLAWYLSRRIPNGRIKRVLFKRHPLVPTTEAERNDWLPALYLVIAAVVQFVIIFWLMP